jgi:hypothetical protein
MTNYQAWALLGAAVFSVYFLQQIAEFLRKVHNLLWDIRASLRGAFPGAEKRGN